MAQDKLTGLRKRQQIKKANRTMFMWVIGASIVVSIAIVAGQFLVNQALYNGKVLDKKYKASTTLQKNLEAADELKKTIAVLNDNAALRSIKSTAEGSNLQVVIDALPTKDDALALGSSLQLVILPKAGVSIESLSLGDSADVAVDPSVSPTASTAEGVQTMAFNVIFSGNVNQVRDALLAMEKTIRPISISNVTIEGTDANLKVTLVANSYYQSAKAVQQKTQEVPR